MSCQIKGIGNLKDVERLKDILFDDETSKPKYVVSHELPVQDCLVSLSSSGDILAMARNTKVVVLVSKWDSHEPSDSKNKFHLLWNGVVGEEQKEWITSLICLPLISLGRASAGTSPDWTCIVIGFNTGFLKFYTETGALLLGQQLHNESIVSIKCQSSCSSRHNNGAQPSEEVYVIYKNTVCILQGFPLFSTLRACRNHLARVQANCNDASPSISMTYKKWEFRNQDVTNDAEVIGATTVNSFNHLMTASMCGGYNALYRSSAPQHSLVLATGKRPFIGFHCALEGGAAPVLSDVAVAMASKLVNAIGSAVPWLRGNQKNSSPDISKSVINEPAEAMTCRYTLSDIMREGDSIVTNSNKSLSAITDAMGRVTLLDNKRGVAIRMWKGYRDAQCGWIHAMEEKYSGIHKNYSKSAEIQLYSRSAFFLVIYAPRKGVIDIWGIQQGPKITTFTASKNGRLLYINYGLLGVNDSATLKKNNAQHTCVFLDPLGGLKEIHVPFHFALSSKNAKKACDIYLLRKLKNFLREDFDDEKLINEVTNTCTNMKTNEVRLQTIEMLMNNKNILPNALLAAVKHFAEIFHGRETETLEPMAKVLHQLVIQLQQLIEFYNYIQIDLDVQSDLINNDCKNLTEKTLSSVLLVSEDEAIRILALYRNVHDLENDCPKIECKVKFDESKRTFHEFLTCFELGTPGLIGLQKNVKLEKQSQISTLIYKKCMHSSETVEAWKNAAANSNIQPFTLMQFALVYWLYDKLNKDVDIGLRLKIFVQLLYAVCSLNTDGEEICGEYNEHSSWWKDVRSILTESTNPLNAFTAALACKAVIIMLERHRDKECRTKYNENEKTTTNDTEETSEWENVSKDTCQFTLLIGNLEDVMLLNAIIQQRPAADQPNEFFVLPPQSYVISLASILSHGKGSVSEIVAKWLSSIGVHPSNLINTTDVEFERVDISSMNTSKEGHECIHAEKGMNANTDVESTQQDNQHFPLPSKNCKDENNTVTSLQTWLLERLVLLKRHFPYSLTCSVLFANLSWEYAMSWNRDVSELRALDATLTVLRYIPMKRIRHGVCCLLWTLYLKKRMEMTAKLINKLGKLPKERLCVQEIGLSDLQLTIFLQHCVTFFDIFVDAELLDESSNVFVKSEELWEGQPSSGPQPFVTLALSQTPAWYELVVLHQQIANVLYMIAHFNLKVLKPLNNLFDSVSHPYFFQDITDKAMFAWNRDERKDNARLQFLCRVITASMDFVHQESVEGRTLSSKEAVLWMSKCQTLASMWKLNNDHLRIHQVCQLYVNGFDHIAEEVAAAVNDSEKLATDLLPIAGRRMMAYLSKSPDLLEEVSRISTTLIKYLDSLHMPESILANCSNHDTIELIRKISRYLPETHVEYHLVQLMLDATFIYEDKT